MEIIDIRNTHFPKGALLLIDLLQKHEYESYLVGGCVRDILMGNKPHDYDICTNALPINTISLLREIKVNYGTVGIAFGTVVARLDDGEYEITTFRKDKATTGQHRPDSVDFSSTINSDLSRRDFTINALALDPSTGELVDLYNGKSDIDNKVIRAVGDPYKRMKEDPLRILRAIRFAVTLGFDIEDNTFKAMIGTKELLENISKERITSEFRKIFESGKPVRQIFTKCQDIIAQLIPEMKNCIGFNQNNRYHVHTVYEHILYVVDYCDTDDFIIKMAALFHDIAKPEAYTLGEDGFGHFYGHPALSKEKSTIALARDFRLTTKETDTILNLVEHHDNDIAATKKSVKKLLNKLGPELMQKWFILKQADRADHIYPDHRHDMDIPKLKELFKTIIDEKQCFKITDLDISGNDIMDLLKIKPCKGIGVILNKLLEEVISEEIDNNKEALLNRTKQIYKEITT